MSFGGASSGQIRYTISVDDAQAIQKLQGVAQQFQALGTTTQQTTQQMEQMPTVYDEIATGADKVAQSQQTMTEGIKAQGDEVKKSTVAQQSWGSTLKNNIFAITSAVGGIISLVQQYTSLQRQQLVIQKMTNTEIGQRNKIAELTRKHAQAVREFGASSQEVLKIETDLDLLQKKHEVTVKTLEIRQEQLNLRMADFGLNILPNLMSAGGGIAQVIIGMKGLKTAQDAAGVASVGMGIKMKGALIGTGIGAILVAIGGFLVLFTRNLYGVQDAVHAVGVQIGNTLPFLKGFLNMLREAGIWITRILGGEVPASADVAVTAIEDVGDATGELATKTDETQKAIDDMWKTLGEAPNITSALDIEVDKDKLTKKFLDYLPDSLTKDIKVFIKGRESVETIRDSFSETLALAMEMGGKDDKWANKFVNQTVKVLKEKFPDAPGSKELQAALAKTVSGPDTLEKAKKLIEDWKLDPALTVDTSNIKFTGGTPINQWMKSQGVSSINEWAFGKKDEGATKVEGLLDKIKTAVTTFDWKGVSDTIVNGIFAVPKNATMIARKFVDPVLGSMFENMRTFAIPAIGAWAGQVFTWANLSAGLKTITDIAKGFNEWFWQGIQNPKERQKHVVAFAKNIISSIQTAFPETTKQLGALGAEIITTLQTEIVKLKAEFDKLAISFVESLAAGIASAPDVAGKIWAAFWKAMTSNPPETQTLTINGEDVEIIIEKPDIKTKGGTITQGPEPPKVDPDFIGPIEPSALDVDVSGAKITYIGMPSDVEPLQVDIPAEATVIPTFKYKIGGSDVPNSRFHSDPAGGSLYDYARHGQQIAKMAGLDKTQALSTNADVSVGIKNVAFFTGMSPKVNPGTAGAIGAGTGGLGEAISKWLKDKGIQFAVTGGPIVQWPFGHGGGTGGTPTKDWMKQQGVSSINEWAFGKGGGGKPGPAGPQEVQITRLQKALANLANQGANSMRILAKAATTNFNTVANYARGATPDVFKLQKALANLANQGANSTRILGKAATTNFNTVANYASGAIPSLTKLQKALANLANQGSNSMRILAKASKTNFNTVANYANGATTAVEDLQSAIDDLKSKTITVKVNQEGFPGGGFNFQHGYHGWVNSPMKFTAGEAGPEYVSVTPANQMRSRGSTGGGGDAGGGNIVVNLTNVLADREITRTFRREMGKDIYRFGPS